MKIPVFLPVTREFGFRDEFAQDCLLQRGVCKLSVPSRVRAASIPIRRHPLIAPPTTSTSGRAPTNTATAPAARPLPACSAPRRRGRPP
jgi:hypothetical protein